MQITDADRLRAAAAGWQRVAATPPFGSAGQAMLMTDGTVFVYDNSGNWFTLTPDSLGSYVNGTWSQNASLPTGYAPLYFGSAITNAAAGHVVFARTQAFSSMAVASSALVSTLFDVPSTIETGASNLVVVTNGIQSQPVAVTIQ